MLIVRDIWEPVQKVLGTCSESVTYSYLNEAVELLRTRGRWDPNEGLINICTDETEVTLPMDVEVPLAINIGGQPADFRNKWFEFNQSGPGSDCCGEAVSFTWADNGFFPTFKTPRYPSTLVAYPDQNEGTSCSIRVLGYDQNDKWIMTADSTGTLVDGFLVPVLYGVPVQSTIQVKRFVRIMKPVTHGFVKLMALNSHQTDGVLLGYYLPGETDPQYRRIKLNGNGCNRLCAATCQTGLVDWVRMRFRKKGFLINSQDDQIFLDSVTSIKMACMAIKKYEADLLAEGDAYLVKAVEQLNKTQKAISGPNQMRVQFQAHGFGSFIGSNMA